MMPPTCGSAGGRGPPNGFCAISACKAASNTMTAAIAAAAMTVMPRARPAGTRLTGNSTMILLANIAP